MKNIAYQILAGALTVSLSGCSHLATERVPASHGKHGNKEGKTDASPDSSITSWIELGPNGESIARALSSNGSCPEVTIGSESYPMQVRAGSTADGRFPETVCELSLPPNAGQAFMGNSPLPAVSIAPKKIMILGDTGCRVKERKNGKVQVQNCNDPKKGWPFAELAAAAARLQPDLVIHVGDYHYREAACPAGNNKCAGSPFGDTWDSWNADFFTPVQPLLASAPWIFVRGNHEICSRAQEGFFRFLDPRPLTQACEDTTPPYAVPFENLMLAVMDSSAADPTAQSVASLGQLPLRNAWLVTHRPLWISEEEEAQGDDDGDKSEENGAPASKVQKVGVPPNISLVFTGHRHLFRALTFNDHRPPQITAGNGGTKLEGHPTTDTPGTPVDADSTTLASADTWVNFGFILLQQTQGASWSMGIFDKKANPVGSCQISPSASSKKRLEMSCEIDKTSKSGSSKD